MLFLVKSDLRNYIRPNRISLARILELVGYWWDSSDEGKKHYGKLIFDPSSGGKLIIMGTYKNILSTDVNIQNLSRAFLPRMNLRTALKPTYNIFIKFNMTLSKFIW